MEIQYGEPPNRVAMADGLHTENMGAATGISLISCLEVEETIFEVREVVMFPLPTKWKIFATTESFM